MANKAQSATISHPVTTKKLVTLPAIEHAIRTLAPSGAYADIIALFEWRVPYSCIREWRRGRARAPQWALDLCARQLAERASAYAKAEAIVRTAPSVDGRRTISAANIRAWNERRANERSRSKRAPAPPASSD